MFAMWSLTFSVLRKYWNIIKSGGNMNHRGRINTGRIIMIITIQSCKQADWFRPESENSFKTQIMPEKKRKLS